MTTILEGKTAFVSGGSGGFGRAICERFAREGAQVVVADFQPLDPMVAGVDYESFWVLDGGFSAQVQKMRL